MELRTGYESLAGARSSIFCVRLFLWSCPATILIRFGYNRLQIGILVKADE